MKSPHQTHTSLLAANTILAILLILADTDVTRADDKVERVKKMFDSDHYALAWGNLKSLSPECDLEIGYGEAHEWDLNWIRFKPMKDKVSIIQISYVQGKYLAGACHPEDRAKIEIKATTMEAKLYAQLLDDISVVDSAITTPAGEPFFSSLNLWVSARVIKDGKKHVDLDYCGSWYSKSAYRLAKPRIAVRLAKDALEKLKFQEHTLSDAEKVWTSDRFTDLWNAHHANQDYDWALNHVIDMAGYVGNKRALSTLKKILLDKESDAFAYSAINATTRLVGEDVRDKPVEKMDIKANREKALKLIRDIK